MTRLLRSLCFLYSLLIAGLCHSVKNRSGAISNDRMVAHFGCKQRLLKYTTFESHNVCEQWELYPEKWRTNHNEA